MGGKSSSSNHTENITNTTTTNTNATVGISGDQNAGIVSGVNNSTISMVSTDHGAVNAATGVANKALDTNRLVVDEAMSTLGSSFADMTKANGEVTTKALDKYADLSSKSLEKYADISSKSLSLSNEMAGKALDGYISISDKSLDKMSKNSAASMAAVKEMAVQSGASAKAAILMAENTASRAQTGSAGDMSKVSIAAVIAVAVVVAVVVMARGK